MKYPKPVTAHTKILMEALCNGATFKGRKNRSLIGIYIGTVDHPFMEDLDGSFVYESYPAIQIPTGEILWIDNDNDVRAVRMFDYIRWGKFLDSTPVDQRTSRPKPAGLYPRFDPVLCDVPFEEIGQQIVPFDELPF